jgi:uncharacterized membrane protein YkvI
LFGFFVGALIYGLIYPTVMPALTTIANYGSATFPEMFNLNAWLTALVFIEMVVVLLYVLEKKKVARREKMES